MDDEKFDLNSRIWVWFNSVLSYDNIIAHDFLNEIDGCATFADVIIGLADRCPLSDFLGDTLIGSSSLLSKIADLCDVDLDTALGLWEYASGEDIDQFDKEGILHMIDAAKKAEGIEPYVSQAGPNGGVDDGEDLLGDHPDCAVDRDWREQFDEVVSPSEQVRYDEMLAAEEQRKAETFDSFMEVNETPMDEVRSAGIAMVLMQGIVFAEIAKKIDGPSEELNERIATFNHDLKRLYNEPLHKKVEQIENQVGKLEEKAAIYDEMRYTAEHTDPADIRIAEGSTSMTGALMAAAMASYDLSCGLIDDEHIGRYSDVITALEERMGVGAGGLSVQTEAGELIANAKEDGISVGINIPGGKCADIAFVDADPGADDLYPTPVRAFTYNGRDEEPDHRTDVHLDGDMVLDGQMTAETPAHVPADITAAAKEAAAKSVKPDTVGTDGIKH